MITIKMRNIMRSYIGFRVRTRIRFEDQARFSIKVRVNVVFLFFLPNFQTNFLRISESFKFHP